MVVKADVKYKVIFQSKYEGHCSQNEVKHVLPTGIRFFWFSSDIRFFRKKKLLKFPCFEKMHFPAILRVKKKSFFLSQLWWSIVTKLRTYYQAAHFLIGQKKIPFICLLSFITIFVRVTADMEIRFLTAFFASKKMIYKML